jgi:type VII secretion protein EccE
MTAPGAGAQEPPRQPAARSEPPEHSAEESPAPSTAPARAEQSPTLPAPLDRRPAPFERRPAVTRQARVLTRRQHAASTEPATRRAAAPDAGLTGVTQQAAQARATQDAVAASAPETVDPPRETDPARQGDEAATRPPLSWPPGWLPAGARRWLDAVGLAQIACWQVAAVLVVMPRKQPLPAVMVFIGASVALVALTGVRWGDRWMYQWCVALLAYLTRRRHVRAPATEPPGRALLDAVSRRARIETLAIGDAEVGVITHRGGATAVFVPSDWEAAALASVTSAPLPSPASLLPLYEPAGPSVTAQVVVRTMPALAAPDSGIAAASYWQLTANRVPVDHSAWVAVQVQRDVDHLTDEILHTILSNIVRRLLRRVRKQGQPLDPLMADDLPSVIGTVAALGSAGHGPLDASRPDVVDVMVERWRGWQTPRSSHTTLCVREPHVDDRSGSTDLVAMLAQAPAAATTVSIAARRREGLIEGELVVDVAGTNPHAVDQAANGVRTMARRGGFDLQPLDGYQRAGIASILPLGGFQPW